MDRIDAIVNPSILSNESFASKVKNHCWIGSVQGAVATWSNQRNQKSLEILLPITDQVATAPCTDPIQAPSRSLRQSLRRLSKCLTSSAFSIRVDSSRRYQSHDRTRKDAAIHEVSTARFHSSTSTHSLSLAPPPYRLTQLHHQD